jgi:hypothetical protein
MKDKKDSMAMLKAGRNKVMEASRKNVVAGRRPIEMLKKAVHNGSCQQ